MKKGTASCRQGGGGLFFGGRQNDFNGCRFRACFAENFSLRAGNVAERAENKGCPTKLLFSLPPKSHDSPTASRVRETSRPYSGIFLLLRQLRSLSLHTPKANVRPFSSPFPPLPSPPQADSTPPIQRGEGSLEDQFNHFF